MSEEDAKMCIDGIRIREMSITATSKPIDLETIVHKDEKGSSELEQDKVLREFIESKLNSLDTEQMLRDLMENKELGSEDLESKDLTDIDLPKVEQNEKKEEGLKQFFKTIKPWVKRTQYAITAGSILLHGSSVASIVAKKVQDFTGANIFGLADVEEKLTEDAAWFCRYVDSLPTILSGLENMLDNKSFSLGVARSTTAMQMLFPNIANKTFGGGIANAHNSQKFLNDRALKAGFIDELIEAEDDSKSAHFKAFMQNSLNVTKASFRNLFKGKDVYHSIANLTISPLALLTFGIGVPFCRGDKLKVPAKKLLRSLKGIGMILFNVLMVKLGNESKSEDITIKATSKADSSLAKLGILEAAVGALTGWIEDNDFLLKLKTHFCYTLKPLINLGWNNRETLINVIKKNMDSNLSPAH